MNACVIKLDNRCLYLELPASLVRELLADIVTRYERLFTFMEPIYPQGKPELLFKALADGYGLPACTESVGVDVLDLRAHDVEANAVVDVQWKEPHVGRILAQTFASTINCS